jgi:integrase
LCANNAIAGSFVSTGSTPHRASRGRASSARFARSDRPQQAATDFATSGEIGSDRSTVGYVVTRWAESRTDIGNKSRLQCEWAAKHISAGIGSVRVDRLDRTDMARWLDGLAQGGHLSRRSISVCRTVLRAALADAVEAGDIRRSPAARVPMPRNVVKVRAEREVDAWEEADLQRFLATTATHRWGARLRLAALYGLRRSEVIPRTTSHCVPSRGCAPR